MKNRKLLIGLVFVLVVSFLAACGVMTDESPPNNSISEGVSVSNQSQNPITADKTETTDEPQAPPNQTYSEMKVHFIDVGQADSTLIESNGKYMLIDAGNQADGSMLVSYLRSQGVSTLDYFIGTHPHEDHMGGAVAIINAFEIKTFIIPPKEHTAQFYENMLDTLISKDMQLTKPNVGDKYSLGNASFIITGPVGTYGDELNNWSVGVKLTNGSNSFIFAGDAESEAEYDILSKSDISGDVLRVNHHGSDSSTSNSYLNEVNPKYAVISVGSYNSYGHPTADVINKLKSKGVKIFRTDAQGTIIATSNGTDISWSCEPTTDFNSGDDKGSSNSSGGGYVAPVVPDEPSNSGISASYILNKNTKKFHYPDCGSVSRMKEKNKEYYNGSRDVLISRGYSPCGNCHP